MANQLLYAPGEQVISVLSRYRPNSRGRLLAPEFGSQGNRSWNRTSGNAFRASAGEPPSEEENTNGPARQQYTGIRSPASVEEFVGEGELAAEGPSQNKSDQVENCHQPHGTGRLD
jgi:hypothetical protein